MEFLATVLIILFALIFTAAVVALTLVKDLVDEVRRIHNHMRKEDKTDYGDDADDWKRGYDYDE